MENIVGNIFNVCILTVIMQSILLYCYYTGAYVLFCFLFLVMMLKDEEN